VESVFVCAGESDEALWPDEVKMEVDENLKQNMELQKKFFKK